MFQTLHNFWYSCISYFSEPDIYVVYWENVIRNDEHLREIGDILGIRPPYEDIMSNIIDPWIWSESTINWFYYEFHAYGVYRRRYLFEAWCTGGSRGSEWGVADLTWEQWNRIMPDFLHITMEDLMRLDFEPISQPVASLEDMNSFLRHPELWLNWDNMTWWERNILFNKYLGVKYYQWKMYLEDLWRYKSYWFLDTRDYLLYFLNLKIDQFLIYFFKLVNFFSSSEVFKLFDKVNWRNSCSFLFFLYLYIILIFIFFNIIWVIFINLFFFVFFKIKKVYHFFFNKNY